MVLSYILACQNIMALLVFPQSPFISVCYHGVVSYPKITVYFGLPEYHGIVSYFRSPFISACLCIMAASVLPNHRLVHFGQNITASVFISYHQISHNCRLWRLDHLSWLFSCFSFQSIIISLSWLDELENSSARWALCIEKYLSSLSLMCWEVSQLIIWQMPMKAICQISPWRLYVDPAKAGSIRFR